MLEARGRSAEALGRLYEEGEFDATWYCSPCHQRPDEDLEVTRARLGIIDIDRMERTNALIQRGSVPC